MVALERAWNVYLLVYLALVTPQVLGSQMPAPCNGDRAPFPVHRFPHLSLQWELLTEFRSLVEEIKGLERHGGWQISDKVGSCYIRRYGVWV